MPRIAPPGINWLARDQDLRQKPTMTKSSGKQFERHRQPWTAEEIQKLHQLAKKGMALKAIAKALTRSEESVKDRAKADNLGIAKLR
jgi:DNA-binding NarL/FixJ family response regulator